MSNRVPRRDMKWWGWGEESVFFDHADKPSLGPFVREHLGLDLGGSTAKPPRLEDLSVPEPVLGAALRAEIEVAVGAEHVHTGDLTRVVHGYGKSLRDLVRVRRGDFGRLPDVVVMPASEAEIVTLMQIALDADVVLIAFGGGTNISGSLEAQHEERRTVISVDLRRLDRVVSIDATSNLAVIQAGAMGPDLEAQLNDRGWTLGHFPDSFNHSTLGGWIATRSSGMQSDKYGDIADMTRGLRAVTPNGVLEIRAVPSTSTGPSVREMMLGSEGRLGIITEATVQVHRQPDERSILGYFFPTWTAGLAAMRDLAASGVDLSVTRISDANETAFSLSTRKKGTLVSGAQSALLKQYLKRRKGFDLNEVCLSFIGFEGSAAHIKRQRQMVSAVIAEHGGFCVGSGPGVLYDQKKFDTPYIRDFLLDRGALADVSETSTTWASIGGLYEAVITSANVAFASIGVRGWMMCHLSHSYHSGACLYFTFAFEPNSDRDSLEQYDVVKRAVQQAFIDSNGTLSHHHAVGLEHQPWLGQDISHAGVAMIQALVDGVDPHHNLNPGKIVR